MESPTSKCLVGVIGCRVCMYFCSCVCVVLQVQPQKTRGQFASQRLQENQDAESFLAMQETGA